MGEHDPEQVLRSALLAAQVELERAAEQCSVLLDHDGAAGPRNNRAVARNIKHARKFVWLALDETPAEAE